VERGALGRHLKRLVAAGAVTVLAPFAVDTMRLAADGRIEVIGWNGLTEQAVLVDQLVVATGLRPDLRILSELRLGLDPALECPAALGPLIDPNVHSCGTVRPHGALELAQPEPGLFIAGMKSYGRAPTFLLAWGSSYYLPAVLAKPVAADTGWPLSWVIGSLSIGLLVSGLISPRVGHFIERHGGRPVLATSAVLLAMGLLAAGSAPQRRGWGGTRRRHCRVQHSLPAQGLPAGVSTRRQDTELPRHYSRFDAEKGGLQIFGHATQNLPQFRLVVDQNGDIYAVAVDELIYGRLSNVLSA
jgi:arsenite oxidase small subunit